MDVKLCSQLKTLSADARLYMSSIKNADVNHSTPAALVKWTESSAVVRMHANLKRADRNANTVVTSIFLMPIPFQQ